MGAVVKPQKVKETTKTIMEKASKRTNGRRVGVTEPRPSETDSVRHISATFDSAHHLEPKRP